MSELGKAEYVALARFRHALRVFLHQAEERARKAGITPQQYQLLLAIRGREGRDWASVSELADALRLRHHTVVGLVNRSVAAGLVTRDPNPDDRRQVRVAPTPRGDTVLASIARENVAELRRLRRSLDLEKMTG